MYATSPPAVVFACSPSGPCPPDDQAQRIARLKAGRIPNGLAFASRLTDALEFDDSLPAIAARRRDLLAAIDEPSPTGWERRSARLQVVV